MLTVGQGDTGQLGLGEDVMEKTRPQVILGFPSVGPHLRNARSVAWPERHSYPQWHLLRFRWQKLPPQVVNGIESAVDVAAGGMHTAVLDSNGKVSVTSVGNPFNGLFIIVSIANYLQRFGLLAATTRVLWVGILRRKRTASCQARWVIWEVSLKLIWTCFMPFSQLTPTIVS